MTVDFKLKRVPACTVACVTEDGRYSDRAIRASFAKIAQWTVRKGLSTGRWFFIEQYEEDDRIRWDACIEVKGKARSEGKVRVKSLRASDVVSVSFNPDEISARIVYHAINDWIRWRKRDGSITRTGRFREVYPGDPWKDATAWENMEVQLIVSRGQGRKK